MIKHPVRHLTLVALILFPYTNLSCADEANSPGWLLVANKGDHTLGIIDPVAGKQIAAVPEEGNTGHEVVASPDGKCAFVPVFGDSGVGRAGTDGELVRVIDLEQKKITGTVNFGKGVRPHCAVFGPKDGLLYVTAELAQSVAVIDPAALKIIGMIPTGQAESHMLAITRDGRRGYTANVSPGTVSVLDMESRRLVTTIPVCKKTQRISLSVDDRWIFTSDQNEKRLAVIDAKTNGVARWIELPGIGYGTAPTPDGRWLIVAMPVAHQVAVIDLQVMKVAQVFDVPRAPQEVLVRPDGGEAYVSCDVSAKVAVIDVKGWKVSRLIDAGPGADGLAWARRN